MTIKIKHFLLSLIAIISGTDIAFAQTGDSSSPGFCFAIQCQYGFLPSQNVGATHSTSYSLDFALGANYWFKDVERGLYAGARIGYCGAGLNGYSSDGSHTRIKTTQDAIVLPIEVGYSFAGNNKLWALSPYAGIDLNYVIGGKSKTKGSDVDSDVEIKKELYPYVKVGGRLRLYGFNIGGAYNYPLKDDILGQREGYFSINIGYGF